MNRIPPQQPQHNESQHLEPPKVTSIRIDCPSQGVERLVVRNGVMLVERSTTPAIGVMHA